MTYQNGEAGTNGTLNRVLRGAGAVAGGLNALLLLAEVCTFFSHGVLAGLILVVATSTGAALGWRAHKERPRPRRMFFFGMAKLSGSGLTNLVEPGYAVLAWALLLLGICLF